MVGDAESNSHDDVIRLIERVESIREQLDELRRGLETVTHGNLSRAEYDSAHRMLGAKVDALDGRLNELSRQYAATTGAGAGRLAAVSLGAVVISFLSLLVLVVTHLHA